ncbi:hypothetical protein BDR03DRAFT_1012939 [Suillus americanus]|nr:hypothetical protein BDR03DRAFT_1012939 [Suillus americanus]
MVPYYEFVSHVFPEAALQKETAAKHLEGEDLLRFSAAPDDIPTMDNLLAPNIPSVPPDPDFFCFETSPESDLPTLPMPDGYIPSPSPPLPYAKDTSPSISMFFDGNSNLDSFEDALRNMQPQSATTELLCSPPHIHYQFGHSSLGPAHVGHQFESSSLTATTSSAPTVSCSTTPATTPSKTSSPTLASAMPISTIPVITPTRTMAPAMSSSAIAAPTIPVTTPTRMIEPAMSSSAISAPTAITPARMLATMTPSQTAPVTSATPNAVTTPSPADSVAPPNSSNIDMEPPAKPEAALQKETAAKRLEGEDLLHFSAAPDDIPTMDNLLAPNIPSVPPDPDFFCFETSPESDLPTLPMPDGYIPSPSPPLPYAKDTSPSISMFFDGNSNLDSFEDALRDMQPQGAATELLCSPPRIRYQFGHSSLGPAHVGHQFESSSLTATTSSAPTVSCSTTPATTPSKTSSPTLASAMPISTIPVITPTRTMAPAMSSSAIAAPTIPVTTPTRMIEPAMSSSAISAPTAITPARMLATMTPSQTAPVTSATPNAVTTPSPADSVAPPNSSNIDMEPPAKRQKKSRDARTKVKVVESHTPTVGRGKRQRFQSTRAAVANAIG